MALLRGDPAGLSAANYLSAASIARQVLEAWRRAQGRVIHRDLARNVMYAAMASEMRISGWRRGCDVLASKTGLRPPYRCRRSGEILGTVRLHVAEQVEGRASISEFLFSLRPPAYRC